MKQHITQLLLVLLVPVLSFAQQGVYRDHDHGRGNEPSTLSIFSENGEQFLVVLNGISQNNVPTSKIRIDGLPQYGNDIEIVFTDNRTQAIRKRVNIADPVDGKAVNMTLKIVRNREGFARLKFHKCTEVERDYRGQQDEYCMNYGQPRQVTRQENIPPPQPRGPQPMDPNTFNDLKQSIANGSFESTKVSTAKTVVGSNYVTTDQVIEIINLFSFENTKLEFAKFAYNRTVDPNNYFKVGNAFSFDSNKEDLNNYLSSHPR